MKLAIFYANKFNEDNVFFYTTFFFAVSACDMSMDFKARTSLAEFKHTVFRKHATYAIISFPNFSVELCPGFAVTEISHPNNYQ